MYNCPCSGDDINKIFDINWAMGVEGASIPNQWPEEYHTQINKGKKHGNWQKLSLKIPRAYPIYPNHWLLLIVPS